MKTKKLTEEKLPLKKKSKRRSPVDGVVLWNQIKESYITRNVNRLDNQEPVTLSMLAEEFNVPYGTLRNKASQNKWHYILSKKRAEVNEKVLDGVIKLTVEEELKVRTRQALIGRAISSKAMRVFQEKPEAELAAMPIKDLVSVIKSGIDLEFRALGLADRYELKATLPGNGDITVEDAIEEHQQTAELCREFANFMRKMYNGDVVAIPETTNAGKA